MSERAFLSGSIFCSRIPKSQSQKQIPGDCLFSQSPLCAKPIHQTTYFWDYTCILTRGSTYVRSWHWALKGIVQPELKSHPYFTRRWRFCWLFMPSWTFRGEELHPDMFEFIAPSKKKTQWNRSLFNTRSCCYWIHFSESPDQAKKISFDCDSGFFGWSSPLRNKNSWCKACQITSTRGLHNNSKVSLIASLESITLSP